MGKSKWEREARRRAPARMAVGLIVSPEIQAVMDARQKAGKKVLWSSDPSRYD